jgi:hypothetical protein
LFECDGKRGTATISAVSFFTTKPPKRTPKRTPCMPAYLPKGGFLTCKSVAPFFFLLFALCPLPFALCPLSSVAQKKDLKVIKEIKFPNWRHLSFPVFSLAHIFFLPQNHQKRTPKRTPCMPS